MIDLHTHSTISDGTEPPEVVIANAAAIGLTAIALTDHDTLEHLPAAQAAADTHGIRLIPGCEISCTSGGPGELHVLAYFIEPGGPLDDYMHQLQAARNARMAATVERLNELGLDITIDEVTAIAGHGVVGRPHIALALMEHGYVNSVDEAFERYLGNGKPAFVKIERLDAAAAFDLIHASGGIAVIAHPYSLRLGHASLDAFIGELTAAGLDGLECEYSRYSRADRDRLLELADRHGLVPTGGSDYHGAIKPDIALGTGTGDLAVPDAFLDALDARRP